MRRPLVAVLAVALLVAACGSSAKKQPASVPPPSLEYTGGDAGFYDVPSPLPGKQHGDLIRFQRLADVAGAHAYRVMYRSVSVQGRPIAVTGLAAVPIAEGRDRVVLSFAHGTTGIADVCAPSRHPDQTLDPRMALFISRGWAIVATDYEGLGTPGRHPFIAGVSEGRGVLDAVRAARQLPSASIGRTAIVWGHSQGGHAAVFADQLSRGWTPELRLVGVVAGAPPSDLAALTQSLSGGAFQGYMALAAAGLNAAYPDAALDAILTPKAVGLLGVVDRACTDDVFAAFNGLPRAEFVKADPESVPVWKRVLAENDPGQAPLAAPLLIIHGLADEQIPPAQSEELFRRLCTDHQVVERRTYPGADHAGVILPSILPMISWMADRVAGKPAPNGCS